MNIRAETVVEITIDEPLSFEAADKIEKIEGFEKIEDSFNLGAGSAKIIFRNPPGTMQEIALAVTEAIIGVAIFTDSQSDVFIDPSMDVFALDAADQATSPID